MKIEMTADLIGEDGSLHAGDIIEMEKGRAVPFIQAGYARAVIAAAPETAVAAAPTQQSVEAELTAMGVTYIRGADLASLIALRDATKPIKPAKAKPAETVIEE
jgi:hypothetical protein